jgi:UDP-glucose 4-epimerase
MKPYYDVVVGGAGFIGSHLVDELVSRGHKVFVIDDLSRGYENNINAKAGFIELDITHEQQVYDLFEEIEVDTLYNLATKGLIESLKEPELGFMTEVSIALMGAKLARDKKIQKLVHFSSSEVYGDNPNAITSIHDLKFPTTPYAVGKLAGQMIIENFMKLYNIDAYIIVPFNNFGPRQTPEMHQGIIPKCIKQMMTGDAISINGTGDQHRDYIYVKDTVNWALQSVFESTQRIFNISAGNIIKIMDLVNKIAVLGGWKPTIKHEISRPGDQKYLAANIKPEIKLTDFNIALAKTVKWYEEYYGHV